MIKHHQRVRGKHAQEDFEPELPIVFDTDTGLFSHSRRQPAHQSSIANHQWRLLLRESSLEKSPGFFLKIGHPLLIYSRAYSIRLHCELQ